MKQFTNPLDSIRVASPCSADWNQMYGNDRKRFCADCKLNVYNLSDMTRQDAENLIMASEGRLCVRYFRRADGTVLTKDCPVGWQAVKRRVSRAATAAFSMVAGLFGGIFASNLFRATPYQIVVEKAVPDPNLVEYPVIEGGMEAVEDQLQENRYETELVGIMVREPEREPGRRAPKRK